MDTITDVCVCVLYDYFKLYLSCNLISWSIYTLVYFKNDRYVGVAFKSVSMFIYEMPRIHAIPYVRLSKHFH